MSHGAGGRAEIDSRLVRDGVWSTIRELAGASDAAGDPVRALAFSVSGNEATALDVEGNPLALTISSMDTRGDLQREQWEQVAGRYESYTVTGVPPHVMHPLMRLAWIRANQPEVDSRMVRLLCWGDLLAMWLGVEPGIDYSMASCTMAFDIRERRWSDDILERAGVHPSLLGNPVPTGTPLGTIPSPIADDLGLRSGIVVAAGGFDQPMAALGTGCLNVGEAAISAGTWESVLVVTEAPVTTEATLASGYVSGCFVYGDRYYSVANNPGGSSVVSWLIRLIGQEEVSAARARGLAPADLLIQNASEHASPILVTPHLAGAYNPWMDSSAVGIIHGLTLSTDRADLIKGFIQGITFELKTNLDRLEAATGHKCENIVVTGGGSRSDIWMQLRADILGRHLSTVDVEEPGCLAAACVAGVAIGAFETLDESALANSKPAKDFEPRAEITDQYDAIFARYLQLYPATRHLADHPSQVVK